MDPVASLSLEDLASQAEVDVEYVRQLAALGAFRPRAASDGYDRTDVRRVHFLRMWEAAGYKGVADLVRAGELAVSWFDAPAMTRSSFLARVSSAPTPVSA